MRRSALEMIAEILWEARVRHRTKSAIRQRCGVNSNFIKKVVDAGLLIENPKNIAEVTIKGNEFLIHFQALQKLCPKASELMLKEPEEIAFKMG